MQILKIDLKIADAWLCWENDTSLDYCYGGTRFVPSEMSDTEAQALVERLAKEESGIKNQLINLAIKGIACEDWWPTGLRYSTVGAGRCLIRPHSQSTLNAGNMPEQLAIELGKALNELNGTLKLTPDFGRYASAADLLLQHTPHVLGVSSQYGGGGNKSVFTVAGLLSVMDSLDLLSNPNQSVTLIGSAGALGSGLFHELQSRTFSDTQLCDISYNAENQPAKGFRCLRAQSNCFTDEALQRGGVIVATTWGGELENSNIEALPEGSWLLLAHNLALPANQSGADLISKLKSRRINLLPPQLLTFGGAAACRLEWYSRADRRVGRLNKPLARQFVSNLAKYVTKELISSTGCSNHLIFDAFYDWCQPR